MNDNELRARLSGVIDRALAHWDEHGEDELVDTEYAAQAVIDDLGLTVDRHFAYVAGLRDKDGTLITEGMAQRVVGRWEWEKS